MNDPRHPAQPLNPSQSPHPAQPLHPSQPRSVITPRPAMAPPRPAQAAPPMQQPIRKDDAPISLDDEADETAAVAPNRKIVFGPDVGHRKHDWQRQTKVGGTGAVRMRSFHGKLSERGLEDSDDAITPGLAANPD